MIKYELNGIYFNDIFISFQSIECISKIQFADDLIDIFLCKKYYYFKIRTISNHEFIISDKDSEYCYKLLLKHKLVFSDIFKHRISLFSFLFEKCIKTTLSNYMPNPRLSYYLELNKDNCKALNKNYHNIENIRNTMIKKFNQWKIYYFN